MSFFLFSHLRIHISSLPHKVVQQINQNTEISKAKCTLFEKILFHTKRFFTKHNSFISCVCGKKESIVIPALQINFKLATLRASQKSRFEKLLTLEHKRSRTLIRSINSFLHSVHFNPLILALCSLLNIHLHIPHNCAWLM